MIGPGERPLSVADSLQSGRVGPAWTQEVTIFCPSELGQLTNPRAPQSQLALSLWPNPLALGHSSYRTCFFFLCCPSPPFSLNLQPVDFRLSSKAFLEWTYTFSPYARRYPPGPENRAIRDKIRRTKAHSGLIASACVPGLS